MRFSTKNLALSGIIASLYVILSLVTFPIASGSLQLRLSEGLTLLPLIMPQAIIGVTVGCLISNILTACLFFDVVFGSLVTLIAGTCTFFVGKSIKNGILKSFVGGLFPVVLNAFFLPLIWIKCYGVIDYVYPIQALMLLASQSISVYALGIPSVKIAEKLLNRKK